MISIHKALIISGLAILAGSLIFFFTDRVNRYAIYSDTQQKLEAVNQVQISNSAESTKGGAVQQITSPIRPIIIDIPSLNISTQIEPVGINPNNGSMAVPSSYYTVAWFEPGFRPGEPGRAVLAGHYDNSLGLDGVFKNLDRINIADEIILYDEQGNQQVYVVDGVTEVPYNLEDVSGIFGPADKPRISVITCGGSWIGDYRTYDKRTVVSAVIRE